jgi:AraC-like DNA-binding protein
MDAFSETLRAVRLVGAFFVEGRFTSPWCYRSPCADALAPILEPGAERVVIFHLITQGECFVDMDREPPLHLQAGDAVLFPYGDEHLMTSSPGLAPSSDIEQVLLERPRLIELGGGGASTQLLCGYMACDARMGKLLLGGLPTITRVHVRHSDVGGWLDASVRYALLEARSGRPGGEGVLSKLAEVLFIEMLRLYMNSHGSGMKGWLAGMGDRVVSAALNAIHAQPAHDWTLGSLATHVGSSRSVLAERFQQLVGTTTMQYLTQWRMLLAANLLARSNTSLAQIAQEVGYETDTALSRAFRREYGIPPGTWRRLKGSAARNKRPARVGGSVHGESPG